MRFAVVHECREDFSVAMMCRLLEVSESGYYAWAARPESNRARSDRALAVEVRAEFARSKGRYGSPRMQRALRSSHPNLGRRRTAKIMRREGLVVRPRRGRPKTTDSKHTRRIAPNLLKRNFTTTAANEAWVGDITYIATFSGRMYLAVLLDLFSRKVVGWALANHMRDELVLEALEMAVRRRRPSPGVTHHTDRGSQYASDNYLAALSAGGFAPSMSRKADCWDNAVAESFFASLKTELGDTFESASDARARIRGYIEDFYNCQRLHSSIGYVSPVHYELLNQTAARAA